MNDDEMEENTTVNRVPTSPSARRDTANRKQQPQQQQEHVLQSFQTKVDEDF